MSIISGLSGSEQWGLFNNGNNSFPISFTDFACIAAAGERTENTIKTVDKTGFTAVLGSAEAARTYISAGL